MRSIVRHQGRVRLHEGDSREVLKTIPDNSVDSVVCDPPYALTSVLERFGGANAAPAGYGTDGAYARASAGFMGMKWDTGETAFAETFWREVRRVLKPGGYVVAFGGTRTYHHLAMAVELAGFDVRDQLAWIYGTGFPKSHPQPDGSGTMLKPSWEPIVLARKALTGKTIAANIAEWGTGGLWVDQCRIPTEGETFKAPQSNPGLREGVVGTHFGFDPNDVDKFQAAQRASTERLAALGRFPANILHDGSAEVLDFFPDGSGRFFYSPKASKADREEGLEHLPLPEGKERRNIHPTVKPTGVMEWLATLVTPPGGVVLDPFMGSGSTGKACVLRGFQFIGIDAEPAYLPIAEARIMAAVKHLPAPASAPAELDYEGY